MQAVTVHKAGPEDAEAIAQMAHALADYEGEPSQASAAALAAVLSEAVQPACRAWVARLDAQPVGFVFAYPGFDMGSAATGLHIADIWVDPALHRHGVGRQLLAAAARECVAHSLQWMSLTVLQGNHNAQAFYRKCGFQPMGVDFFAIGFNGIAKLQAEAD